MHHSWDAIVAHAARNTRLRAGDVLGSGTVGTGCILEHGDKRWLRPGDVVELEIERIGVLRNRVEFAAGLGSFSFGLMPTYQRPRRGPAEAPHPVP